MRLSLDIKPQLNKNCLTCKLYLNQAPLQDNQKDVDVFWVGLSAVRVGSNDDLLPLAPSTRTGSLVKEIEESLHSPTTFFRTNIVKCLPLKGDKIRYPTKGEMKECLPLFLKELEILKPKVVVLFGKQVSDFVLTSLRIQSSEQKSLFEYKSYVKDGIIFIPVHHPSYILVYKRRFIKDFIQGISKTIKKALPIRSSKAA